MSYSRKIEKIALKKQKNNPDLNKYVFEEKVKALKQNLRPNACQKWTSNKAPHHIHPGKSSVISRTSRQNGSECCGLLEPGARVMMRNFRRRNSGYAHGQSLRKYQNRHSLRESSRWPNLYCSRLLFIAFFKLTDRALTLGSFKKLSG